MLEIDDLTLVLTDRQKIFWAHLIYLLLPGTTNLAPRSDQRQRLDPTWLRP